MSLSNTATPKYYGEFRNAVMIGDIPVCKEIAMEMNRIDDLINNPGVYYDDKAVEGFVKYCENEYECAEDSNCLILTTEWKQFENMDLVKIKNIMKNNYIFHFRINFNH